MNNNIQKQIFAHPPWRLHGDAFILNYWLNPFFLKTAKRFRLASSPLGRMVNVMLIRYQDSPVGPYDELLIMDHPLLYKHRLSTIPKIYVSTQASLVHGQQLWGIPKELAEFEWLEKEGRTYCIVRHQQQEMSICLERPKNSTSFYINSHHIPASFLSIQQAWQGQRYQFSPKFRGRLSKLKTVEWQNTQDIFPDFSQARLLQSFYVPEFDLLFPEAQIKTKTAVPRETRKNLSRPF
ncbi:acetoacetate decarboxylase family protein [Acinetobacter indicus]|uniref:acetoacetate decarboxylase family protein n=1 Tax=Acinetobacter indicus TaxID=756892 RepID=UPI001362AC8D|nr:acetoacetate decarboxylase family protein [Acinetobacter indicus]